MINKHKLFIGSSVEGLVFADSVKAILEHSSIRAEVWTQGTFMANGYPLEQLEAALDKHQYGLFVMTPDDIILRRDEQLPVARDNLLLELGMFIGRYGRNNCFILIPRGEGAPKMPSDLTGFNTIDYDADWSRESIDAAMGTPVRNLRVAIEKIAVGQKKVVSTELLVEEKNKVLESLFSLAISTKPENIMDYLKIEKGIFKYHIDALISGDYIQSCDKGMLSITEKGRKQVVEVIR
ncbi:nucleotide-binding protein [Colwellia sp. MB02u-10]|uniref:TIR domain-containing protein n=1 Tax=Colwellia sp. MB02u-10 TaxID=2759828 RepID=UPI0015F5A4B6|nr:nucleotide-binding protein [Colwellia sp. MB02u-10]MBA6339773.1 nucleotide-binding protein [Colwellia sp. MB02u-10]